MAIHDAVMNLFRNSGTSHENTRNVGNDNGPSTTIIVTFSECAHTSSGEFKLYFTITGITRIIRNLIAKIYQKLFK